MKCLFCYKELNSSEIDFHTVCSKKFFGTSTPPTLPYTRSKIKELAEQIIRSQTTVTGVQPKLSLDIERINNNSRFTIVGLWGKYILKPQTEQYSHLPDNEDLTMRLAEVAKINTVPHSLIRFADGELCYITKRIDRTKNGVKLPMEDFCQLTERLTEHKYHGSHEQIAKAILKFSTVPKLDLVNFWEIIIFCFLVGNADMHLKNFSLYSPPSRDIGSFDFQLTPAYDLLSTVLVIPEDKEELALTLNGKKNKLTRKDFETAALNSGLEQRVIENIFVKFQKTVPKWDLLIDNSFLSYEMKENFKNLIQKRKDRILT
ncbi:MAG: HipA domain-containing protein [Candidatus Azobacteroides sp.]|nr:HipA domain-containing protein [Candidatus Azobacteroides sp.]